MLAISTRAQISALLQKLTETNRAQRLALLKDVCMSNGGRWDLPHSDPAIYTPMLCNIQVFGISVFAPDVDALPDEWIEKAKRQLKAEAAL